MTHTNVKPPASTSIRLGLIGVRGIGSCHGESLAWRIPGATLAAVADSVREIAERVASSLDCSYATPNPEQVLKDPSIQAVVIAAPPSIHADVIEAAAGVGKAVFCEKSKAVTLADADRASEAASAAGVALRVGFNRRFAPDFRAAHDLVVSGDVGQPHLLRSLTRDPELEDPSVVKPWTIFLETLIHDFDTLLWLNPRVGRSRFTPWPMLWCVSTGKTAACSTPPWCSCASTTAPWRRPGPASRPSTATTCADRSSGPTEW